MMAEGYIGAALNVAPDFYYVKPTGRSVYLNPYSCSIGRYHLQK